MDERLEIARRLERLRLENYRLRTVGVSLLLGVVAVILMGQATSKSIANLLEARRFVLRDSRGIERASLGIEADGRVAFFILDHAGRKRVALGVTGDDGAPAVVLSDQKGNIRASLWLESDGTPALGLGDGTISNRAVNLQVAPDGPSLSLATRAEGAAISDPVSLDTDLTIMLVTKEAGTWEAKRGSRCHHRMREPSQRERSCRSGGVPNGKWS